MSENLDTYGSYAVLKDHGGEPVRLGAGIRGPIWKAYHTRLGCYTALQVIPLPNRQDRDEFAAQSQAAGRVRHRNVASVYPLEWLGETCLYATQFYLGETLAVRLTREGPVPMDEAAGIARQIASGFAAFGEVHREIAPQNVLLAEEDEGTSAKILDLPPVTGTGATRDFLSPEEMAGAARDARAEVYSLGAVLYCICTGFARYAPFRDKALASRQNYWEEVPDMPARLAAALKKALARDPAARFQTLAEMAAALAEPTEPTPTKRRPAAGALNIPPSLLAAADAGTMLRLKPAGAGTPLTVCTGAIVRIGRLPVAEIVTRFPPGDKANEMRTRQLSKVHVTVRANKEGVLLFDGDGTRPSANGSTFDGNALAADRPFSLTRPGELRLAGEYSVRVTPLFFGGNDEPVVANLGDWKGPAGVKEPLPCGGVLFEPLEDEAATTLWLFTAVAFEAGGKGWNFSKAGRRGMDALRRFRGCFWIEHGTEEKIRIGDVQIEPGEIAPVGNGKTLQIRGSMYSVEIPNTAGRGDTGQSATHGSQPSGGPTRPSGQR